MIRDWWKDKDTGYVIKTWYKDGENSVGYSNTLDEAMQMIEEMKNDYPAPVERAIVRKCTEEVVYKFINNAQDESCATKQDTKVGFYIWHYKVTLLFDRDFKMWEDSDTMDDALEFVRKHTKVEASPGNTGFYTLQDVRIEKIMAVDYVAIRKEGE